MRPPRALEAGGSKGRPLLSQVENAMLTMLLLMLGAAGEGVSAVGPAASAQPQQARVAAGALDATPLRLARTPGCAVVPAFSLHRTARAGGFPLLARSPRPAGTGVVECAVRSIEVSAAIDPGIRAPGGEAAIDPGIRGDISPCRR